MVSALCQNTRHVVVTKELIQTSFQLGESLGCMTIRLNNWVLYGQLPLSFIHFMFVDLAYNLLAVKSREPIYLEKAVHIALWPKICTAFSKNSIQASNLLFVPLNVSIDESPACIMVCFIMMDDSKLPS